MFRNNSPAKPLQDQFSLSLRLCEVEPPLSKEAKSQDSRNLAPSFVLGLSYVAKKRIILIEEFNFRSLFFSTALSSESDHITFLTF